MLRARCGTEHGLADAGRSDEDPGVVREERPGRLLLERGELATEPERHLGPLIPLVLDREFDAVLAEQLLGLRDTAAGQRHEAIEILGACDHARSHRGEESHLLLLVELRILKRGDALQLVEHRRG